MDRPLADKVAFYQRLSIAKYVWTSLFEEDLQDFAKQEWDSLYKYCQSEDRKIFTHLLADLLENKQYSFLFTLNKDKLVKLAEYIVFGNTLLEEKIPDSIKAIAYEAANKAITRYILNSL